MRPSPSYVRSREIRVAVDYNPNGRKDITVTAEDGVHEYRFFPTISQYNEAFKKLQAHQLTGKEMTFLVNADGYLLDDPTAE
jgi:hypothetical protein